MNLHCQLCLPSGRSTLAIPDHKGKAMLEKTEKKNTTREIIGWVVANMLPTLFIYGSFSLSWSSTIASNAVALSIFGGTILLAICQWIFLRHLNLKLTRSDWILIGVASSVLGLCGSTTLVMGLGDYPTEKDNFFLSTQVICGQALTLNIIQGLILSANKYKRVSPWVIATIVGYVLAAVFSGGVIFA